MKRGLVIVFALVHAAIPSRAATNSWKFAGSDFWDIPSDWSLNLAPSSSQEAILITNATTKIVTMDGSVPSTMTISNLVISAPSGATNKLALENAGTGTAFRILNGVSITSGGVLQMTNAFLQVDGVSGGQFNIDSAVRATNSLMVTTNAVTMIGTSAAGNLTVNGGTWLGGTVIVGNGTLTFNSGSNVVSSLFITNGASSVMVYNGGKLATTFTTLANGGAVQFALGTNSIPIQVSSNLALSGILNVTNGGGFTNTTYTLFTYGGTLNFIGLTVGTTPSNPSFSYLISTSTIGQVSLIVTNSGPPQLTPFQTWQTNYFGPGATNNPNAALNADPDGDGLSNQAEFLAGSNPTNSASGLRIISEVPQGNNMLVTWNTIGGTTNILQSANGAANGGYTNAFTDLSPPILVGGSGDVTTNYTDAGGATNSPARYYRAVLLPNNFAKDDTSSAAYSGGWPNGSNGGSGFGPWVLTTTNVAGSSGFFTALSTGNAAGTGPGIDVNGKSWGMFANGGNQAAAFRSFANGSLAVGQSFALNMDNGFIDTGSSVGFSLRNGNATTGPVDYNNGARFQFLFVGGTSNYQIVDAAGQSSTTIPFTGTGLRLSFTLTGADTYTLVVVDNASGATTTISGTLAGSGTLDSICLFNRNAGTTSAKDAYFNSLRLSGMPTPF